MDHGLANAYERKVRHEKLSPRPHSNAPCGTYSVHVFRGLGNLIFQFCLPSHVNPTSTYLNPMYFSFTTFYSDFNPGFKYI
jgi:hypothetical protein